MTDDKGHILVVDDDPLNRMQLLQGLKQQGYSTAQAEDGEQALQSLGQDSFDLVILDILMPNLDGFEVLSHMKDDGALRDIPVVVISALDEMDSVVTQTGNTPTTIESFAFRRPRWIAGELGTRGHPLLTWFR